MKRLYAIIILFALACTVLWGRVFWLQTIRAEELREIRDKQSICTVTLTEENRGAILDCRNQPLTADRDSLSLIVIPALIEDPKAVAEKLGVLFGFDPDILYRKITGGKDEKLKLTPFVAQTGLTAGDISRLEEANIEGAVTVITSERWQKDFPAQHLIGALKVNENGNLTGASGLEKVYNKVLSGTKKGTLRFQIDEKNSLGNENYFYEVKAKDNKSSITLTLDSAIQNAAESALGNREGAVVVLNSQNGDVLALASAPEYDPYGVKKNLDACYVNKALAAEPPASLFKVFIAAVALEENTVSVTTPFVCNGSIRFKSGQTVSCWEHKGHGILPFGDAVAQSCNPVLIQTARMIGSKILLKEFKRWELDEDRLIGYPLNTTSAVKTPNSEIELANITLGESGVRLTPLNVAKMLNVIASGGYVMTPRVVTAVRDKNGNLTESFSASLPVRVISTQTASELTNVLKKTFTVGTASALGLSNADIAGKTGSSETGNVWFGGFFPTENPRYTIIVMIKNGSGGATDAGPVFKKLYSLLNRD